MVASSSSSRRYGHISLKLKRRRVDPWVDRHFYQSSAFSGHWPVSGLPVGCFLCTRVTLCIFQFCHYAWVSGKIPHLCRQADDWPKSWCFVLPVADKKAPLCVFPLSGSLSPLAFLQIAARVASVWPRASLECWLARFPFASWSPFGYKDDASSRRPQQLPRAHANRTRYLAS